MQQRLNISATPRTESGTPAARRIRAQGRIPGVLYGHDRQTVNLSVDLKEVSPALARGAWHTHIYDLQVVADGKKKQEAVPVMIREVQRDPLSGELWNIDFHAISLSEKMEAQVPVILVGEAVGQKRGGILERLHTELTVYCLPTDIPEHIEIDVTALEIGDGVRAGELTLPPDVELITDREESVVHVSPPAKAVEEEEVAEAAEGEEMAEPEVIGQKGEQESEAGEESKK